VSGGPAASYDPSKHRLTWLGSPAIGQPVTVTFPVTVTASGSASVVNTAVLTDTAGRVSSDMASFLVNPRRVWLPLIRR
jgi:hypothetical protein